VEAGFADSTGYNPRPAVAAGTAGTAVWHRHPGAQRRFQQRFVRAGLELTAIGFNTDGDGHARRGAKDMPLCERPYELTAI
jgi:hypothetical protein